MSRLPKISVITPTFNAAQTLAACIESVAKQTYPNKEHLIIDGLSTDETMEIVRHYAAVYPHIRYISEKDQGIYDAMNKGIQLSTGEWLYFLGADDKLQDSEVLQNIFREDLTDYHFVYGHISIDNRYIIYQSEPLTPEKLLIRNVHHQACFYKKELFEKLGLYDIRYKLSAEIDFNIRWMAAGYRAKFVPVVIATYTMQGTSSQFNNKITQVKERILLLNKSIQVFNFTGFARQKVNYQILNVVGYASFVYGFPINKWLKENGYVNHTNRNKLYALVSKKHFLRRHASADGAFFNIHRGNFLIGWLQLIYLATRGNKFFYLKNGIYWTIKRLSQYQ